MPDLLALFTGLGAGGGVFGMTIFLIYRQEKRATEKRLTKMIEEYTEVLQGNTKALTELIILVSRLNGH